MTKLVIRKIGNSYGVILPQDVLASMGVREGDSITLIQNGPEFTLSSRDAEFDRAMEIARKGMDKYRVALRELAK